MFRPEHPKRNQNLKFTPLSETTSIPAPFILESPSPGAKMTVLADQNKCGMWGTGCNREQQIGQHIRGTWTCLCKSDLRVFLNALLSGFPPIVHQRSHNGSHYYYTIQNLYFNIKRKKAELPRRSSKKCGLSLTRCSNIVT